MEVPLPINLFITLLVLFVSSHIVKSCATSGCFSINIGEYVFRHGMFFHGKVKIHVLYE